MSINPGLKYPVVEKEKYVASDTQLGILSDYEFLEYDNDSFVLFNPKQKSDHDILSLTNTNSFSEVRVHHHHGDDADVEEPAEATDDEYTDDDISSPMSDSQYHTAQLNYSSSHQSKISDKIHQWYMSNIKSSYLANDNIALWNFDNGTVAMNLDNRYFYGDDLFKYFDAEDFKKLNQVTKLINNDYLIDKTSSPASKLNSIISKLVIPQREVIPSIVTRSNETTPNSSMILCGGVGFGDNSSWNDI